MFCSISGQVPENPVVSKKSGHLFEKRLITKYIDENGTCPITGQPLSLDDLIEVKSEKIVKPRTVNSTSIPGLLQMFQNEWDSIMLETFTLKKHLDTVRQELSHALYQHDAACRVIARLIKERDEARNALTNIKTGGQDQMEVETGLSTQIVQKMMHYSNELSSKRKKRKISETLAKADYIKSLKLKSAHPIHKTANPGINCLDINLTKDNLILTGGNDGDAVLFDKDSEKILAILSGHSKPVNNVLFLPEKMNNSIVTSSQDATTKIWTLDVTSGKYNPKSTIRVHKDAVTGTTLQASGEYIVTCSLDKTWAFHDLNTCETILQTPQNNDVYLCASFHPDGLILGTGTNDSLIKIWDVTSQEIAATFTGHTGPVTTLSFSENGYFLATGSQDGTVKLWDLRKLNNFHTIQIGTPVSSVQFDYSGSYLAIGAGNEARIYLYQSKVWEEIMKLTDFNDKVTAVGFGQDAKYLAATSLDRHLKLFVGQ